MPAAKMARSVLASCRCQAVARRPFGREQVRVASANKGLKSKPADTTLAHWRCKKSELTMAISCHWQAGMLESSGVICHGKMVQRAQRQVQH